jgi:hypothetical protein
VDGPGGRDQRLGAYDENVGKVLQDLGQPLELVNLGQTKASLRLDSRYIKDVLQRTDQDSAGVDARSPITCARPTAFSPRSSTCSCASSASATTARCTTSMASPSTFASACRRTTRLRLQRGKLVSAADWHRLRDSGQPAVRRAAPLRASLLAGQDRFAASLRSRGASEAHGAPSSLHEARAPRRENGDRLQELSTANTRLSRSRDHDDSHKVLTDLLAVGPTMPRTRCALARAASREHPRCARRAERARAQQPQGRFAAPVVGIEVRAHLGASGGAIGSRPQAEQPLTKDWIQAWNKKAQELIKRLIGSHSRPPAPRVCACEVAARRLPRGPRRPAGSPAPAHRRPEPTPMTSSRFLARARKVLNGAGGHSPSASLVRARGGRRVSRAQLLLRRLLDQARRGQRDGLLARDRRGGAREPAGADAYAEGGIWRAPCEHRAGSATLAVEGTRARR